MVNPKIPQSQEDHIASAAHDVSSPAASPAEIFPTRQQSLSHSTVACFPFYPPSSRDFSEIQRSPDAVPPATRPPTNQNALSHSSSIPNSHEFAEFPRNSRESSAESSRQNSTLQISSPSDSMPIDTSDQAYDTVPQTETSNQSLQQDNTLAQATDTTQQQPVPSPPLRTHGMLSRSQNHIFKPKIPTDGTIGVFLSMPPILLCDNIGATYLTANLMFYARAKHIAIDYHFVCDKVAAKILVVKILSSKDQIADILTKPLVSTRFQHLTLNLKVCPPKLKLQEHIENKEFSQQLNLEFKLKYLEDKIPEDSNLNVYYSSFR